MPQGAGRYERYLNHVRVCGPAFRYVLQLHPEKETRWYQSIDQARVGAFDATTRLSRPSVKHDRFGAFVRRSTVLMCAMPDENKYRVWTRARLA